MPTKRSAGTAAKVAKKQSHKVKPKKNKSKGSRPGPSKPAPPSDSDQEEEEIDYEPESDEASQVSDDDEEDEHSAAPKTVSASKLAFLTGLESDKSLAVPKHQSAKAAAKAKRREKEQIKQVLDRAKADKKRHKKAQGIDSDQDVDMSHSDMDDYYEEYSDVSEGEEVPQPKAKSSKVQDEEQDDAYLNRLNKRKARQDNEEQEAKRIKGNQRLKVRTMQGEIVDASDISDDDDVEEDEEEEEEQAREQMAKSSSRATYAPLDLPSDEEDSEDEQPQEAPNHSSMTHSTRFNLTAPYEICLLGSSKNKAARSQMVQLARNQIASLASQVVADPENSLGMLKRLAVFATRTVQAPSELMIEIKAEQAEYRRKGKKGARPTQVAIDPSIRQLAILSILAVYIDILPGYRIRALSEKEQEERVTQDVARRREYESGLVSTYQSFLELCEIEVKDVESPLHASALRSLTTLATRATHFNFRNNILQCVVARMSRRRWGAEEESCYEALVTVAREDLHGEASLEIVRLIHRMTKERRFKVNSRVLDVLLELRLRDELGTKRAGMQTASDPIKEAQKEREERERKRLQHKIGKGKATPREIRKGQGAHLSKKAVKRQRELKAIEAEMKEAEATVNVEEREKNQTETLKLLFVLYFTILKAERGTVPLHLLGSALEGLSRFAHRVNVDFFRDLLKVLREHVGDARRRISADEQRFMADDSEDEEEEGENHLSTDRVHQSIRHALLCLNTAFELLSGQGDVLNIDLSDLTGHLYALLLPLSNLSDIEQDPAQLHSQFDRTTFGNERRSIKHNTRKTLADLLFRSLDLVLLFPPVRMIPVDRQAAFAKRLCVIALQLPPASVERALKLVAKMMGREDRLLALVDSSDRAKDGVYDAAGDNPDTISGGVLKCGEMLWELEALRRMGNNEIATAVARIRSLGAR